VHPAATHLGHIESYDEWYERANSFDELYDEIVDDLVMLSQSSPNHEVLYVVPGSPAVAERTVELLRQRSEVETIIEPAVSVIDVACAGLGRDPMAEGLRIVDALSSNELLRGPGPLLILQTYSPEVLATVASRLPQETPVTVLHHLGLDDQIIVTLNARSLTTFVAVDHLTSLWLDELRTAGEATDDLLDLMRLLRRECPWDQEQDHASLTRHLLEEAYEALDALENFVKVQAGGESIESAAAHVQEELGDLLYQIIFHAELGDEEQLFNFVSIADTSRTKMIGRHPHVFGDVQVAGANEVIANWEVWKQREKGRESVTDGIAWQLPALSLYAKLLRKATQVDLQRVSAQEARAQVVAALNELTFTNDGVDDAMLSSNVNPAWGDVLTSILQCAMWSGVDLEGVLRERATMLRDEIRNAETSQPK
jgi:tetrapyrrole methylase family protein/MazG family protein